MINPDIFGYLATSLNIVMLVPQVLQTWKTKKTKDLSFASLLLFSGASVLWLSYGLAKNALPVIIANTVLIVMNFILIAIKIRYPEK
ncbi:MAG: SemiSWEET family transporter [Microgenomates group bacterium]